MSFIRRAQKAHERGDTVRALFVLIEGMKKHPDDEEAMDLLLDWYGVRYPRDGLENDVIDVLALQPDGDDLLSTLVDNLRHGEHFRIATTLLARGEARGLRYIPAGPEEASLEGDGEGDEDLLFDGDEAHRPSVVDDVGGEPNYGDEAAERPSSPSSRARKVKAEKSKREGRRPRVRLRWVFLALIVAGGLTFGGFNAWQVAERAAALSAIDIAFETLDPLAPEPWSDSVADAVRRWPRDQELRERETFMHVFLAENLDEVPSVEEGAETRWGLAAAVLAAVQRDDLETALRNVKRQELLYPDLALTSWLRAVVEESRGALQEADDAARVALERTSSFVPAHITRVHVAIRRGDPSGVRESLSTLKKLDSDHPYLALETLNFPGTGDFFSPIRHDSEFTADLPSGAPRNATRFLDAARALDVALRAFRVGKWESALKAAELSAELAPGVASTQLLLVTLRAYFGDAEGAAGAMTRLAELEGIEPTFRTLAQAAGPLALAHAGRPDLARPFLATFGRDTTSEERARLVGSFRKPPSEEAGDAFAWAIYARAVVLKEAGQAKRAAEISSEALERGLMPSAFAHLRHVIAEEGGAKTTQPRPPEGEERIQWELVRAYHDGDHAQVLELSTKLESDDARGRMLRYSVLSHLALRRLGPALVALDAAQTSSIDAIQLQGARIRAFARLPKGAKRFADLRSLLESAEPTGTTRLTDLAFAAFWQGDAKESARLVDLVLAVNEDHRQANWLNALLLRARGRFNDAKPFLQKSGKDYDSSPDVLLELGNVNYELRNWDEARKMFYQALLRDRHSLDALNGLGRAYTKLSSTVAKRDLERILLGYPATAEFSAHRGETLKWLAVIYGAPKGREEALTYLDSAESLVGRRADLLMVRAEYHEARKEPSEARKLYAQALQRNSTMGEAHLGLARTALAEDDKKVARDHLRRYVELEPGGDDRDWAEKKLAELK